MTAMPRAADASRPRVRARSAPPPTLGLPPRPAAPSIEDILGRLTLLAPLAAGNRGPVPLDDPRRVAAAEYTWLLATARENGVSTAALVQATTLLRTISESPRARRPAHGWTENPIPGRPRPDR